MDMLTLAYLLVLLGVALLVAEVFIPSGGFLFALAIVAIIVGVALAWREDTNVGIGFVIGLFIVLPILAVLWIYVFPKTPIGRKYFLPPPAEDDTLAYSPVNVELEQLRGRYGKTVSALRPAGTTEFDGKRVDTLSEGALIGPDQWVQCVDVEAGKVIVRQVEGPPDLETMDPNSF